MEERKSVFEYIKELFTCYGIVILIFIAINFFIGDEAGSVSTLFALGSKGLSSAMLLQLFLDQMLAVVPASARLSAEVREGMIYIMCDVEGQQLSVQQLSELFSPQTERMEYLVMRQIVREHDAACGHPGLRLVAENTERGYRISFSLLQGRNIEMSK